MLANADVSSFVTRQFQPQTSVNVYIFPSSKSSTDVYLTSFETLSDQEIPEELLTQLTPVFQQINIEELQFELNSLLLVGPELQEEWRLVVTRRRFITQSFRRTFGLLLLLDSKQSFPKTVINLFSCFRVSSTFKVFPQ